MTIPDSEHYPTVSKLLSSQPPRWLFHYTDHQGILGIIKTRAIWATEASYLNDSKEIYHLKDGRWPNS